MKRKISFGDREYFFLLALVILISAFRITYKFAYEKEGHHSDESWSYGFANSYYDPYIYMDVNEDIYLSDATEKNYNEWVPGSVFKDYITVAEDERFSYGSVYFNKSGDISPPFFEMILHTICSLFPGTFSWWYAFSINIVCFVISLIFVYLNVKKLTNISWVGVAITLFYGLSIAGINTTVYLRMYSMMTMNTLIYLYIIVSLCKKDFENCTKLYILLAVFLALGSFSHFYFLLFAFFMTLFICIGLALRKEWKHFFAFGLVSLLGVGLFFLIFPSCIQRLLTSGTFYEGGLKYKYTWNLRVTLSVFLIETLGLTWGINQITLIYIATGIIVLAGLYAIACFLFRKDLWFRDFQNRAKRIIKKGIVKVLHPVLGKIERVIIPSMLFSVLVSILIITKISNVEGMGDLTDRYMTNLMPVFIIALFSLIVSWLQKLKRKNFGNILFIIMLIFLEILQNVRWHSAYLFEGNEGTKLDILQNENVIIVTNNIWRLEWYSTYLADTKKVLCINTDSIENLSELMQEIEGESAYVIFEKNDYAPDDIFSEEDGNRSYSFNIAEVNITALNSGTVGEIMKMLSEASPRFDNKEFLFSTYSFCGELEVYRLN